MPKISVIMPFYNCEKFLDDSILSILYQSFNDFEFIIINDGSTDNSDKIVKKYLNDTRIVYIKNEKNMGIVYNLNKGINIAKAEIIARMDGDDVSEKTRFEEQFNYLNINKDISVVGTFIKIIDQENVETDHRTKPTDFSSIKENILLYSPLVHPSVMYRKSVIKAVGQYRQKYIFSEDLDLWYRIVFSGYKLTNIPLFLLKYRYHENSTAHKSRDNAMRLFRLRKDIINEFNISLSIKKKILINVHFLVCYILSGRQRQYIEGVYKKIFLNGK